MTTRRQFLEWVTAGITAVSGGFLAVTRMPGGPLGLTAEHRRTLLALAAAVAVPPPRVADLTRFDGYLRATASTAPRLTALYRAFATRLQQAPGWNQAASGPIQERQAVASAALADWLTRGASDAHPVRFSGEPMLSHEVPLKDVLLFFAGENRGPLEDDPTLASRLATGARVFEQKCAACHAPGEFARETAESLGAALERPPMSALPSLRGMPGEDLASVLEYSRRPIQPESHP